MLCVRMRPNYCVVVVFASQQIKRVARPAACNYERICDIIFPDEKYGSVDYELQHLINELKKNGCSDLTKIQSTGTYQSMRGVTVTLK